MRFPSRHLTAAVAAGLTLALPAVVHAQTTPDASEPPGQMYVTGSGLVTLDGQATMLGVMRSPALIVVRDRFGDARLIVGGREIRPLRTTPQPPVVSVRRFRLSAKTRRFLVRGTNMNVRVESPNMSLTISGHLRARLDGAGTYTVNEGQAQAWDPAVRVGIGSKATPRARRASFR